MSKYGSTFNQEVVSYHCDGKHSYREVGLRFGLDHSMVRMWVASHAPMAWLAYLESTAITKLSSSFRLQGQIFTSLDRPVPSAGGSAVRYSQLLLPLGLGEAIWRGGLEAFSPRARGGSRSMPKPPVALHPVTDTGEDGPPSD